MTRIELGTTLGQVPLRWHDRMLVALLASFSGAAVLAHAFGPLPMVFTVPFLVMPTVAGILLALLARRRLYGRIRHVADLLALGFTTGLAATLLYDAVRPVITATFTLRFNPYGAMPIFGSLMTGRPPSALAAKLRSQSPKPIPKPPRSPYARRANTYGPPARGSIVDSSAV
jgi:peptidoglycan/LPS O-acetylase OafA/YrhL